MHDIVIRFPNAQTADEFCSQLSDGIGEGFCDFSYWRQKPGTDGKNKDDYEMVKNNDGMNVYFVTSIF